jgi:prepilin-type N-terminal cleavage/methylation domain-containing protein
LSRSVVYRSLARKHRLQVAHGFSLIELVITLTVMTILTLGVV